jgi:type III secretion protein Q
MPFLRDDADRFSGSEALRQNLPRLSGACRRVSNLFYGPRAQSELTAGAQSLTWQWRHREASDATELVRLDSPQGDVWIAIERDHGFGADIAVDWRSLEHDARLLAWSLTYEPVIQHLRALLGIAVEPVGIAPAHEVVLGPTYCSLSFDVTDESSRPVLSGKVSFHPELLSADFTVAGTPSTLSAQVAQLPVPFRVVVTTVDVPIAELSALAPGDIISLGTPEKIRAGARMSFESKDHEMRIAVRLGAVAARVELIETGQRPASSTFQGSNQRPFMPSSEESPVAAQVDGLPVTLSFEAGEISLTVAELRALAPGAMLSFGRKLGDSPITIRANGRVLGVGELVLIDDFLGVRLIELRDHGSE